MKRGFVIVVVTAAIVALTAGTALASPPPWANSAKNRNQLTLNNNADFGDVSGNYWAHNCIRAMYTEGVILGYPDGNFRPNQPVKRIEALAMIMRLVYGDEDVQGTVYGEDVAGTVYGDFPATIPLWAQPFVAEALDDNIITEDELGNFRPNQAAKRSEVVLWLGRALELDETEDYGDVSFSDVSKMSPEALTYLAYLYDQGYVEGYPAHGKSMLNKFMPQKPVTRAEMARILSNVLGSDEDTIEPQMQFRVRGQIVSVADDELVVRVKGQERTFTVGDDVIVFIDKENADYGDLQEGDSALVIFATNAEGEDEALVIYANTDDEEEAKVEEEDLQTVEGTFTDYSDTDQEISMLVDEDGQTYDLADNVDVAIGDDEDADLDELVYGMELTVKLDADDKVVSIEADNEVSGVLNADVAADATTIEVDVDDVDVEYDLADPVDIDGDATVLTDLVDGTEVTLTFEKGEVVTIDAHIS